MKKEEIKKNQTILLLVSFTDEVINQINSMVNFFHEYADGELFLVFTDNIT